MPVTKLYPGGSKERRHIIHRFFADLTHAGVEIIKPWVFEPRLSRGLKIKGTQHVVDRKQQRLVLRRLEKGYGKRLPPLVLNHGKRVGRGMSLVARQLIEDGHWKINGGNLHKVLEDAILSGWFHDLHKSWDPEIFSMRMEELRRIKMKDYIIKRDEQLRQIALKDKIPNKEVNELTEKSWPYDRYKPNESM